MSKPNNLLKSFFWTTFFVIFNEEYLKAASGSHSPSLTSVTWRQWVLPRVFFPSILVGADRFPRWHPVIWPWLPSSGEREGRTITGSKCKKQGCKVQHSQLNLYRSTSGLKQPVILQAKTCPDLFFFHHFNHLPILVFSSILNVFIFYSLWLKVTAFLNTTRGGSKKNKPVLQSN